VEELKPWNCPGCQAEIGVIEDGRLRVGPIWADVFECAACGFRKRWMPDGKLERLIDLVKRNREAMREEKEAKLALAMPS